MKKRTFTRTNRSSGHIEPTADNKAAVEIPAWAKNGPLEGDRKQVISFDWEQHSAQPLLANRFQPSNRKPIEAPKPADSNSIGHLNAVALQTLRDHKSVHITPNPVTTASDERSRRSGGLSNRYVQRASVPETSLASLLTIAQSAQLLRVSQKTVRRLIDRGDLATVRIGRSVRIRPEVLAAYIDGRAT